MSTQEEANKKIHQRFYQEVWSEGKLDVVDEIVAVDFEGHAPANTGARGVEGVKEFVKTWRTAFPDITFTVEQQFAEGDKVASHFVAVGTNTGPFMGRPPTGKAGRLPGIAISRIVNGKMQSDWGEFDILGLMMQTGLIPSRPPGMGGPPGAGGPPPGAGGPPPGAE